VDCRESSPSPSGSSDACCAVLLRDGVNGVRAHDLVRCAYRCDREEGCTGARRAKTRLDKRQGARKEIKGVRMRVRQ